MAHGQPWNSVDQADAAGDNGPVRTRPEKIVACLSLLMAAHLPMPTRALAAQQWLIMDPPGQNEVVLSSGATGAAELSGITWAGGNQFYVVGDNASVVYPLTISFDAASGAIATASLQSGTVLAMGSDLEGLAYNPASSSVYVGDESGPAVREHALVDGSLLQTVTVPSVFSAVRSNLSLESLSREPGGAALWTANEEALSVDGPVSSFSAGTTVRLQKLDATLNPSGQWAYVTDSIAGDIFAPGRDVEVSGVSDLLALPGGQLLVFERELGVGLFRHRIYEVDFSAATDVSALPDLSSASYTPVSKLLLWERLGAVNFEGISLGPTSTNEVQSLVLVSDDGGGLSQSLYALTLLANAPVCAAQPLSGCTAAVTSTAAIISRHGEHDRFSWTWRKGTIPDLSPFGDPTITLGLGFAVCVYDSVASEAQLRFVLAVGRGSGWSASGTTRLKYADRSGSADGVTSVKLASGSGTAKIQVRGKSWGLGLPSPPALGNLLSRDPEVTAQFVNRDMPAECFSAVFSSARSESSEQFKAKF